MKRSIMRSFAIPALCVIITFFTSCEKDDLSDERAAAPATPGMSSDVFTINSKDDNGFSARYLEMADLARVKADFIIIPQTNLTGDVMSPFLSNPNLESRFLLSKEFDEAKSAEAYFDSYNVSPYGEPLKKFALGIRANQIWLVKTQDGDFCKILILETIIDKTSAFVEVKFKAEKIV